YFDYAYGSTNYGSWQTVIYENAISAFKFNYGPTVGSNPFYQGTGSTSINGWVWPGSWDYNSVSNYGSYIYFYDLRAICGIKSTGGACITLDWNANGWDATRPFIYAYNRARYGYYSGNSTLSSYSTATNASTVTTDYVTGFFPDTARKLPRSSIKFLIAYNYDF